MEGWEETAEIESPNLNNISLEIRHKTSHCSVKNGIITKGLTSRRGIIKAHHSFPRKFSFVRVITVSIVFLLLTPIFYSFQNDRNSGDNDCPTGSEENSENPELVAVPEDTITFSARESLKPRKNHDIAGTRGYNGTSLPVGDWVISGNATVWNETITLNGNLTVTSTGNLTLINVTLRMNCSFNGEFHIEVLGGGGLYIYDFDWDRFTEDDASNITAVNTAYQFLFWVQKDSFFEMRNSKLSWCGYAWSEYCSNSGLRVMANNALIDGNVITNCWYGLILWNNVNNSVINNTIKNNSDVGLLLVNSSNNMIINNSIHNNIQHGLYFGNSKNNNVINNRLFQNAYSGLMIIGSIRNNISQCKIHSNLMNGIHIQSSSYENVIFNNSIFNNTGQGIYMEGNSYKNWISNVTIRDNVDYGMIIDWSSNNIISNCTVSDNGYSGIYLYFSSNNVIIFSNIYNNTYYGILIRLSSDNLLSNCTVSFNGYSGIYLWSSFKNNITTSNIFNNSIHGILFMSSYNNYLKQNNIFNNSAQGILLDSSSDYNNFYNIYCYNNTQYGLYLISSSYNNFTKYHPQDNMGGILLSTSSFSNRMVNSSFNKTNGYDIRLYSNSHLIVLNTIFNNTNIYFADSSSTFEVQWYLHIKVTNLAEIPIPDSTVIIRDNSNGSYEEHLTTDSEGLVKWIIVSEYIQDSSKKVYLTPHNITASFIKYIKEYTKYIIPEPRINSSKFLTIIFGVEGNNLRMFQMGYPGWNLISFPFIQSNTSMETVLKPLEGYYDAVQVYNTNDTLDPWKHYSISKPSFLNDLTDLNHKMGFWIHLVSSGENGYIFNGSLPGIDQSIRLYPGWNLVGYPSLASRYRDIALNNLQFGEDVYVIFYYDAKRHSWETLDAKEPLKSGLGYWFYVKSEITWIVNVTIPPVHNLDKGLYYDTLQEGIDDADELDIIEIAEGTFYENIKINKSIILTGSGYNRTFLIGGVNVTDDMIYLTEIGIKNSIHAIVFNDLNEGYINRVAISNCTYGLSISNVQTIDMCHPFGISG